MDPNTITLRRIDDIDAIWGDETRPAKVPSPGWFLDGIDPEDADWKTFLADESTAQAGSLEYVQNWAADLISRCTNYRVIGWVDTPLPIHDAARCWRPRLVERHHEMTFFDVGGIEEAIKHQFGSDRWTARAALAALKDPDGVIELRRPAKRQGVCLTETTLHVPVRNLTAVQHVVTEHEVPFVDPTAPKF